MVDWTKTEIYICTFNWNYLEIVCRRGVDDIQLYLFCLVKSFQNCSSIIFYITALPFNDYSIFLYHCRVRNGNEENLIIITNKCNYCGTIHPQALSIHQPSNFEEFICLRSFFEAIINQRLILFCYKPKEKSKKLIGQISGFVFCFSFIFSKLKHTQFFEIIKL